MARFSSLIDEPKDTKRIVYVSWVQEELSAACLDKLKKSFGANNQDNFGREIELHTNDVSASAGQAVGEIRNVWGVVTDFIGLLCNDYIISRREACQQGIEPDLIYFIKKRKRGESDLIMWLFPIETCSFEKISFKGAEEPLPNINFEWWHGDSNEIQFPSESLATKQRFSQDINHRVLLILEHDADNCKPCTSSDQAKGKT